LPALQPRPGNVGAGHARKEVPLDQEAEDVRRAAATRVLEDPGSEDLERRSPTKATLMPDSEHAWDGVATDLVDWLETESKWYADAMRGGSQRSPFAAQTSEAEKLDYYRRQMYTSAPDGSILYDQPNQEGRSNLMQRLGVDGYTQVYQATKPEAGRRAPVEPEPDEEPI
jgi:hypothetical protein